MLYFVIKYYSLCDDSVASIKNRYPNIKPKFAGFQGSYKFGFVVINYYIIINIITNYISLKITIWFQINARIW